MGKSSTHNQLAKLITSTVKIAVSEAMAELRAELSANEELLNYVEVEEKPKKAKAKPKAKPKVSPKVVIKGHPTRETWTQAMHDASRKAYNEASGSGSERNYAGLLAAKKVA